MKFVVGSTSKMKVEIVRRVLKSNFKRSRIDVFPHPSESHVSDTPLGKETFKGATNRAIGAKKAMKADYYVGLESGLIDRYGIVFEEAWCCMIDKNGRMFYGYSSGLKVPDYIIKKMRRMKIPHYKVMKLIQERYKTKMGDTWGTYSGSLLTRDIGMEEALRNALVQIISPNGSFYRKS